MHGVSVFRVAMSVTRQRPHRSCPASPGRICAACPQVAAGSSEARALPALSTVLQRTHRGAQVQRGRLPFGHSTPAAAGLLGGDLSGTTPKKRGGRGCWIHSRGRSSRDRDGELGMSCSRESSIAWPPGEPRNRKRSQVVGRRCGADVVPVHHQCVANRVVVDGAWSQGRVLSARNKWAVSGPVAQDAHRVRVVEAASGSAAGGGGTKARVDSTRVTAFRWRNGVRLPGDRWRVRAGGVRASAPCPLLARRQKVVTVGRRPRWWQRPWPRERFGCVTMLS